MITQLSILIPVYNDVAAPLVDELRRQAAAVPGLEYEIVVFDDGSTDASVIKQNEAACTLPRCRYVRTERHSSRSAMRNAMARCGRYEWHLMLDARVSPMRGDFIRRYLDSGAREGEAVVGGVTVDGGAETRRLYRENLRFRYEKHEEKNHSLEARRKRPYASLRTTNFFHHRSVLERVPYDERVKTYGYEDVLLGKALQEAGIRVLHIDNPVAYTSFESNARYLCKLDEALSTLHRFAPELKGYSPLLALCSWLRRAGLLPFVRLLYRLCDGRVRKMLAGRRPLLLLLKFYKVGSLACMR